MPTKTTNSILNHIIDNMNLDSNNIEELIESSKVINLGNINIFRYNDELYTIILDEHMKKHDLSEDRSQDIIDSIKDGSFFY